MTCEINFNYLPNDILKEVFSHLDPSSLGGVCCVCKKWNAIGSSVSLWNAFDLKKLFPMLRIIDETVWKKHVDLIKFGLSLEDVRPLDKRAVIPLLRRLFTSGLVEKDAGWTLLTIPKNLGFKNCMKIAQSPKEGNATKVIISFLDDGKIPADKSVNKTYRILISNDLLNKSKRYLYSSDEKFVKEMGCQMPSELEVMTFLVMTYFVSNERLYGFRPSVLSRCDSLKWMIGAFSKDALHIMPYQAQHPGVGVAGVVKQLKEL
jgi:hypothetical protein